jgi:hypothetical protein
MYTPDRSGRTDESGVQPFDPESRVMNSIDRSPYAYQKFYGSHILPSLKNQLGGTDLRDLLDQQSSPLFIEKRFGLSPTKSPNNPKFLNFQSPRKAHETYSERNHHQNYDTYRASSYHNGSSFGHSNQCSANVSPLFSKFQQNYLRPPQ